MSNIIDGYKKLTFPFFFFLEGIWHTILFKLTVKHLQILMIVLFIFSTNSFSALILNMQ